MSRCTPKGGPAAVRPARRRQVIRNTYADSGMDSEVSLASLLLDSGLQRQAVALRRVMTHRAIPAVSSSRPVTMNGLPSIPVDGKVVPAA